MSDAMDGGQQLVEESAPKPEDSETTSLTNSPIARGDKSASRRSE